MHEKIRPRLTLLLLTGLNFFNYIDRTVLFGVQPLIQAEFHRSDTDMGFLTTAFFACYIIVAPFSGIIADRSSRKLLMVVGAVIWSAATLLTAVTHSYEALLIRHVIVGIGEATFVVVAPGYIADLFSLERRGRMLSLFYLAIPMGSAAGYILGGHLGPAYGWRSPFYVAAIPGFAIALALYFFTSEPERGAKDVESLRVDRATASSLLSNPAFIHATLGMAMLTFALGGIQVWMPTFLSRERALPLEKANFYFGIILVIDGLVATLIGGWLGDWLLKRKHSAYYSLSAWSMALGIPAAVFAIFGPPAAMFPAIAIAVFFLFLNNGPLNAAIVNSVPPAIRSVAIAVNLFVIHVLGDVISPTIIGHISDRSSLAFGFIAAFVAMLLSALVLWRGMRYAPAWQTIPQPAAATH